MRVMKREEIEHLATLARIRLTEAEISALETDLTSILSYVSVISEIAADDVDTEPMVGARFNVFREDEVTNKPDEFTEDILKEMPATEGRMMKVKKILQTD